MHEEALDSNPGMAAINAFQRRFSKGFERY